MAKTCRTCKSSNLMWVCDDGFQTPIDPDASCSSHEPCETPLLMDGLAEVLNAILAAITGHWFSYTKLPGKIEEAEHEAQKLLDRAYMLLARYQKEVGDA